MARHKTHLISDDLHDFITVLMREAAAHRAEIMAGLTAGAPDHAAYMKLVGKFSAWDEIDVLIDETLADMRKDDDEI